MTAQQKPLRVAMPRVTAFVDALREAFGHAPVDRAIRNGLAGGTDFYARENGHSVGHMPPEPGARFTADQLYLPPKKPKP